MIRSATLRARQLAKAGLGSERSERRVKTFEKRTTEDNDVYYVMAKKGLANNKDANRDREFNFFEMPNLVLDLDAEGAKHVRSFDDADEQTMRTRWDSVPKREAVRARLAQFEEQVNESRSKAHHVLSEPMNIWRVTPHDIISAALFGGSTLQKSSARDSFLNSNADEAKPVPALTEQHEAIQRLQAENGIPSYAVDNDQLLLHWMDLRYEALQHSSSSKLQRDAPSLPHIVQAMKKQSSLTGIRRLIFQCLLAGTSTSSFQHETGSRTSLSRHVRDACERILTQSPSDRQLRTEMLIFLGNLAERLSSHGTHMGPLLYGLALRLSAEIGSLEAVSPWLRRCDQGSEAADKQKDPPAEDVLSALICFRSLLSRDSPSMHGVEERQLLFEMLTGIDENNQVTSASFKALATKYVRENDEEVAKTAFDVYASYIALLGQLGASRTIWREWRELTSLQTASVTQANTAVLLTFGTALRQAVGVMTGPDGELSNDASLYECVATDSHAIGMQDPPSWRKDTPGDVQLVPDAATCQLVLEMPFQRCVEEVRRSWAI